MAPVSFAFVPRILSKHAKPWEGISRFSSSPDLTTDSEPDNHDHTDTELSSLKGKGKERAIQSKQFALAQDITFLISLALSDYNIWLDSDLRSKLDACLNDETFPDAAGFVPINYLLRRTPFRGSLPPIHRGTAQQPEPSEADVVKVLRTHANHVLEVRMRLPSTSSSVWYGTGKTSRKKDVGGYEVRRKDWSSIRTRPSRGWTRAQWDDLTIYMEGIPPPYRTLGGIARFAEMLLPTETGTNTMPHHRIQYVVLPPHYLDKPGDIPNCKGYALVTFSSSSNAEALLHAWPWTRRQGSVLEDEDDEDTSEAVKDAIKCGLRTIFKACWDALNEEYLVYKRSLVDEMNAPSAEMHPGAFQDDLERQEWDDGDHTRTTAVSSYPFDCLVFVRNVQPETNKTTLKALFGCAFQDGNTTQSKARLDGVGLDYVDFTKGMDTCYLRLASPQHALRLIAYFSTQSIVQADGLDAMGRAPVQGEKSIALEMVKGTKEALYWEKVPEKVRRQAVDKVIKAGVNVLSTSTMHTSDTRRSGRKKRAREY